ncbi:MAG TPA: ATP-binding protein [Steroidobacteraceae bacterium]
MKVSPELLAALDLLPEPMLLANVAGQVLAANSACADRLGVTRDELNGRRMEELSGGPGGLRQPDSIEFLSTLAHELRNPLAPIRNALEVMRMAEGDHAVTTAARSMIERQLKHLVRLIDDLMDVSRVTQGRLVLTRQRVPIESVLQRAAQSSRPLLESKQHRFQLEPATQPLYVEADASRLAQVFSNLFNNSAKYSAPGSTIAVSVEREGAEVLVSVRDHGVGIPPEMLGRVFDMFVRLDRSGLRPHEGLGIGLTLVKRIVELHGGRVEAHSGGAGEGSTFRVRLPLSDSPVEAVLEAASTNRVPHLHTRILVADDNRDAAQSLAFMLEMAGHDVRTAHDGLEAIEIAESFRPQIILLDIGMPRLDGYGTARELRGRAWGRAVCLVALTGWGQEEDRLRAQQAGFDRHLVKPVDPEILNGLIAQALQP